MDTYPASSTTRLRGAIAVSLALVGVAAGCATTPEVAADRPAAETTSSRSVTVDGVRREYRLFRPRRVSDRAPLVIAYHGWTESVTSTERDRGWKEAAQRHGFVVAFPVGVGQSFNAGACCGTAQADDVDDVAAAHAIVDDVARVAPIDPRRIYATGFSNGGMMAYRLACESDRMAAVGPVAGTQVVDCAQRPRTSILHIHGTADSVVPPRGVPDDPQLPAVDPVVRGWRSALRCGPTRVTRTSGVRRSSTRCPGGRAVDIVTIDGLDHTWPTADDGLDATETLWRFFARHRR